MYVCMYVCVCVHTSIYTHTHIHTQLAGRKIPRGEICMRGKNVMMGYLKLDSETAAVLSSDGWLRTGDIGQWNVDGCVREGESVCIMYIHVCVNGGTGGVMSVCVAFHVCNCVCRSLSIIVRKISCM